MPAITTCPDVQRYHQMIAGQTPADDAESLLAHLETCEACAAKVASIAEQDTLVDLIRQASTLGDSAQSERLAKLIAHLCQHPPTATRSAADDRTVPPNDPPAAMMTFRCPECGKSLKVKASIAGKRVKCPHCQQTVQAPARDEGQGARGEEKALAPAEPVVSQALTQAGTQAEKNPARPADNTFNQEESKDAELTEFLAPPQGADELGRLGPYRILKILGAGGMGVVYQAEDPQLMRLVALKAMLPSIGASSSAKKRFLREARSAAAIKHDHIVGIYQVGEERGVPFLAMEFLKGEPLDERLKREEKLPLAEVLRIGREMADGLAAAHEAGLIHRDIKPANLWLEGKKGRVKILDFGLARAADESQSLTQSGAIIGTPAYMAPEQAKGKKCDHRCDLFSLGVVLYRLCTGQQPFHGEDTVSTLMAVATHEPPAPVFVNPELPQELSDLVMKLLEKDADQRPASANEVVETLQALERGEPTIATSLVIAPKRHAASATTTLATSPLTSKDSPRRRRMLPFVIVGALLALVGLGGVGLLGVILFPTDDGAFAIETDDPDFSFKISKGVVTLHDEKTKRTYKLKVVSQEKGRFELEVSDPINDLAFVTDKFTIKRGEKVALKAWFQRKVADVTDPGGKLLPPLKGSPLDLLDAKAIPPEERFDWQPKELVAVLGSHRQRLWHSVFSVFITADGKRVMTGVSDAIFDFDKGTATTSVGKDQFPVISGDGRLMLTGGGEIFDLDRWEKAKKSDPDADPKIAPMPIEGAGKILEPQFSTDGRYFACLRTDPERVVLLRIDKEVKRIGEWPGFRSPALSFDGKMRAMIQAKDKAIHLVDIQGDKVQPRGPLFADDAKARDVSLRFANDSRLALFAADGKSIAFWNVAGPKPQSLGAVSTVGNTEFRFASKAPRMVGFLRHGSGFGFWRLTDKGAEELTVGHQERCGAMNVTDVAISADGNRLVSGHLGGAIAFWEVKGGKLLEYNPLRSQPAVSDSSYGANFHFSPKGDYLTTLGENGTTVWHFEGKSPKGFLPSQLTSIDNLASAFFSADAFAHGSRTWRVTPTAIKEIKEIGEHPVLAGDPYPLAAENGSVVARTRDPKQLGRIVDFTDLKPKSGDRFEITSNRGSGYRVSAALSANGRVFANAVLPPDGKTDAIRVFDIQAGKATKRYDIPTKFAPIRVRLSRDGQWLAASDIHGHSSGFWRLENAEAKLRRSQVGHACSFSPDGKRVALLMDTGGHKLEVRDLEDFDLVWSTQLPGGMYDAVFAPDGRHLLVANRNQTAYILRLP